MPVTVGSGVIMRRHIIVSGDDPLATTIVGELEASGEKIIKLSADELVDADLAHATAVVCAGDDDATNLEIALLARRSDPDVRVVARLANNVLREAMAVDSFDPCGVYFGTTGGQVYASADGGNRWAPIVRDLPPVLSVEVQTLQGSAPDKLVIDVKVDEQATGELRASVIPNG